MAAVIATKPSGKNAREPAAVGGAQRKQSPLNHRANFFLGFVAIRTEEMKKQSQLSLELP